MTRSLDSGAILRRLEPEMVPHFKMAPLRDLSDLSAARATSRRAAEAIRCPFPAEGVLRRDHFIEGFEGEPQLYVREYRPASCSLEDPMPALLWAHGGGFIMGFIESDEPTLEHIATTVGCCVFAVDWRWAPENPYPASMHDCLAAALWLNTNSRALGVDPEKIAIGGNSSGAGSVAGLALLLRDRGAFQPCFQLLIYPMLDDRNVTPSSFAITDRRLWSRDANLLAWKAYLGEYYGTDNVPIYAAPSRAVNLAGLPSAFVIVGDLDLFLDEDIDYAQRLLQAGVPTELHVYPGAVHGFDKRLPDSRIARTFERDRDSALAVAFARS